MNNNESEFIFLNLLITDKKQEIVDCITNLLSNVSYQKDDMNNHVYITVNNNDIMANIELLLDDILNNNPNTFRYMIDLYENNKKYPYNITINKKGKKVITKNKTKMSTLKI